MKIANKKESIRINPLFLMEIEKSKIKQIYPQLSYDEQKDLSFIWNEFNNISTKKDLQSWINKFRLFTWGEECEWEELDDIENREYYKKRIDSFMGINLFNIISKDIIFNNKDYNNYEDFIDMDFLLEDIENKSKIRKTFFNQKNINPDNLVYEDILTLAEKVGEKYNLSKIIISDSLCFEDIYSYLISIDYELNNFINVLNIDEVQIGLKRLTLAIEIDNLEDSNLKTINVGINSNNCFAYKWIKFIDNIACDKNSNINENVSFSEKILGTLLEPEDPHYLLKKSMNEKYKITNLSFSVIVMRKMLRSLPDIVFYMKKYARSENEIDALDKIAILIDQYIATYENKIHNVEDSYDSWIKCKKNCERILSKTKADNNNTLFKLWLYVASLTERISFNEKIYPVYKLWFILSVFISRIENNSSLSLRSEMLARGFTSIIRYRLKKDNWIANDTQNVLFYPKNEELHLENIWWENNLDLFIKAAYND